MARCHDALLWNSEARACVPGDLCFECWCCLSATVLVQAREFRTICRSRAKASAVADAGKFDDPRWRAGTWDITKFTSNGKINWDAVIDAEVSRRKWLEENPEASSNSEPAVFDTATVPWWAWVKRFHLPEAELLNGPSVTYSMLILILPLTNFFLPIS